MYKLIIIDDEEKIASGMAQLFPWQNIGFEVVQVFTSARKALQYIAENPVDVVLTDHDMPEMDGVTLAGRIRAAGLTMPILLLSSNPAMAREREGAVALDAILQKPVLRAELYRRLEELAGPVAVEAPPAPEAPVAPVAQRQMRVLAAEDNKTNQLVFQKMVKGIDIELRFANNGREAIVPNEVLITQRVENSTYADRRVLVTTTVQVAYGTDLAALEPRLLEAIRAVPRVITEPA